jgi:hypothetical protein
VSTSPTRPIRTSTQQVTCDVCGRTLLRGERAEIYISGGSRHSVCELCTARALHGGWVREGTVPDYGQSSARIDRRRSLLGRRRRPRRDQVPEPEMPPVFADELLGPPALPDDHDFDLAAPVDELEAASPGAEPELADDAAFDRAGAPEWPEAPVRNGRRGRRRRPAPLRFRQESDGSGNRVGAREPRHVHAVPTSVEHKIDAAVELFNGSEHPRTVAGITRSLGLPDVSVYPTSPIAAIVNVVLSWELCWYRYEIDLSEGVPAVRGAGQGYELSELSELERAVNVSADERGLLTVG